MGNSLQILRDDLLKLWAEVGNVEIAMTIGIIFFLVLLKMTLNGIDPRDVITELMYVVFVTFTVLVLTIVVPDLWRPRTGMEAMLVTFVVGTFIGLLRWNIRHDQQRKATASAKK